MVCNKVENIGFLEFAGKTKTSVLFKECVVNTPLTCTVAEPISVEAVDQLIVFEGKLSDEWAPTIGVRFATLTFAGAMCPFAGAVEVLGTATATVDNELEAAEHTFAFTATSGSELEAAGKNLTFRLKDKIHLVFGESWSAR